MHLRFIVTCLLCFPTLLFCEIPNHFSVKYDQLQSNPIFSLENLKEEPFAKGMREIDPRVLLSYRTLSDVILAYGIGSYETVDSQLEVIDHLQKKIGTILRKKKTLSPLFYQILNQESDLIAEGSMNWLGTRFILSDPKNPYREYATFYRPYFRLPGDHWYVQIHSFQAIDSRLIVMTAILQTFIDKRNFSIKTDIF